MATDQAALHDLITVLHAPDLVLSGSDGQVRADGGQGWYSRDLRALARLEVELAPGRAAPVGVRVDGPDRLTVHSVITGIAKEIADPKVLLSRRRKVSRAALHDEVRLHNHGSEPVAFTVRAHAATDLAGLDAVRSGRPTRPVHPLSHDDVVRWQGENVTVSLRCAPPAGAVEPGPEGVTLTWAVELPPGSSWSVELAATAELGPVPAFAPTAAAEPAHWTVPELPTDLAELVAVNLADLDALLLADPQAPADTYTAAGAPWYLTLFGRDALWTARMLLPLAPGLAAGTLRTLARRQGAEPDPVAESAPGKILHEARPGPMWFGPMQVPALYFGSIDATALWVRLLHDAWQAGMPEPEVAALLPNLVAAMGWLTGRDADPDGDGLLEYAGSAHGLANQGWKDSADAIRHADGRHATAPVALSEVQGYAYAAAAGAASLAGAFGLPHGAGWLTWARRLRERFHAAFWLTDEVGPYPAIALDADKRPVSGAASNMAHLLGTGLLDDEAAKQVADRLAAPDLTTPYGLRTLSTASAAFNPVSYHCGSIWPHDTAIAIMGLASAGHDDPADALANGLLRAARHFAGRPPELFGVLPDGGPPVHYPSACRPQAWAAAAVIVAALRVGPAGAGSASGRR
ncbi:MAG: glycogen debranching N-terminal domain-containing protein [Labedaea sp.]